MSFRAWSSRVQIRPVIPVGGELPGENAVTTRTGAVPPTVVWSTATHTFAYWPAYFYGRYFIFKWPTPLPADAEFNPKYRIALI